VSESLCNRFRSLVADVVAVLQRTRHSSHAPTTQHTMHRQRKRKSFLTRLSFLTLLILPDRMSSPNAAHSSFDTPQLSAMISSQSTLNSLLPNFTFVMGCANALSRRGAVRKEGDGTLSMPTLNSEHVSLIATLREKKYISGAG
jgi:hypothetical protein